MRDSSRGSMMGIMREEEDPPRVRCSAKNVNKYPSKIQGDGENRNDKMRDSRGSSPPCKMPRRSSSPDGTASRALQSHRPKERCRGGSSESVDGSSRNHSRPVSNSHQSEHYKSPAAQPHEPADDWSEHISSSGKKYYYNCRTEVSQWEKPKEWIEREQRQREAANRMAVTNSFPKDRDYRREAMQATVQNNTSNRYVGRDASDAPAERAPSASVSTPSPSPSPVSRAAPSTPNPAMAQPQLQQSQEASSTRHSLSALHASPQPSSSLERLQEAFTQTLSKILLAAAPTLLPPTVQPAPQAQQQSPSSASLGSDVSSPRAHISPRVSTPQGSTSHSKSQTTNPHSTTPQVKASAPSVKGGQQSGDRQPQPSPESPAPSSSQRLQSASHPCSTPGTTGAHAGSSQSGAAPQALPSQALPSPCTLSPGLAAHYNDQLVRHVQGWPAEHVEKQASKLREEGHSLGSLQMSEICTDLKSARSLVRVSEIQATLREQRILFLRQQVKELEKLKNQNSFMV